MWRSGCSTVGVAQQVWRSRCGAAGEAQQVWRSGLVDESVLFPGKCVAQGSLCVGRALPLTVPRIVRGRRINLSIKYVEIAHETQF